MVAPAAAAEWPSMYQKLFLGWNLSQLDRSAISNGQKHCR